MALIRRTQVAILLCMIACGAAALHHTRIAVILAIVASTQAKQVVNLANYVPLTVCGLGRYASAPALFLEESRGGRVLPVPIPSEAVMATEQALSATRPALLEVVLHAQAVSKRDDGFFDNLPWGWNPSPQAKRDAFARFSGRGYPREGYQSSYHLMVDMMRRDACADVSHVLLEETDLLGGQVVGGALLLERRLPQAVDSGSAYAMGAGPPAARDARGRASSPPEDGGNAGGGKTTGVEAPSEDAFVCECTADEALGLALALGCQVYADRRVWESCQLTPRYSLQRGKMRIEVAPVDDGGAVEEGSGDGRADTEAGTQRPPAPLPWDIQTTDQLFGLSLREKALSALGAGLRLPRARDASDAGLVDLIAPFLDESVRRELAIRQALEAGDVGTAAALDAGTSKRGTLRRRLREAVDDERYAEAAKLALELQVETSRRMDVTQDEGSYDRYLDQVRAQ